MVLKIARPVSAVVMAAALLVGCGATEPNVGGSSVPEAPLGSSAAPSGSASPAVIDSPFRAVTQLADEHARDFHDRAEAATAKCMADRGFTYTPVPYRPRSVSTTRLGDIAFAAEHGFVEVSDGPPQVKDETAGLSRSEAAAWTDALLGARSNGPDADNDPNVVAIDNLPGGGTATFMRNGCVALGEEAVFGDVAAWRAADLRFGMMSNQVGNEIAVDPAWVAAETGWGRCMADAGYGAYIAEGRANISSVLTKELTAGKKFLPDQPIDLGEAGELRMRELAVASATCERDGGMAELYTRLQDTYVETVTERSQGVIVAYLELINTGIATGDQQRVNR